uniref:Uncharacterized protein n=1 Tax=Mycobacterium sp. (strain KMS) TaxID=189918 RepID=A1UIV4_MYCSK
MSDPVLQRFFADPLIAAQHKRCGKLVAVYRVDASGGIWYRDRQQCRCAPSPTLPEGAELAALVERAEARERWSSHRARIRIYI